MNAYQQRVNAERLANQAPAVQKTAKEILEALKSVEQYMRWSLDPEEKDPSYFCTNLIDQAHALVDLGHAWRATLAANPPPPTIDLNIPETAAERVARQDEYDAGRVAREARANKD